MPKSTIPQLPLSALFGIVKPSGPASMAVINDLKHLVSASKLFMPEKIARENAKLLYRRGSVNDSDGDGDELGLRVDKKGREKGKWRKAKGKKREVEAKMGQGGTLDPLADGVLVIGVNRGTKKLSEFLDCVKEYRTTCLLGCETDSYDNTGAQVRTAPWRHVTRESVEEALEKFRGEISQTPPIFSALKMDGKPLYEYARQGIPLPRPIERRQLTVHSLELTHWISGSDHSYDFPEKKFTDEERERMVKALRGVEIPSDGTIKDEPEVEDGTIQNENDNDSANSNSASEEKGKRKSENERERPPAFVLNMRVSGGTYVRSIVHDLGHALGSAAHVVTLTRAKQGRFVLSPLTDVSTPVGGDGHSISTSVSTIAPGSSGSAMATATATASASASASASGVGSTPGTVPLQQDITSTSPSETPKPNPREKEKENKNKVESNKNEETEIQSETEIECIPWAVFSHVLEDRATIKMGADGWRDWEREVLKRLEVVEA